MSVLKVGVLSCSGEECLGGTISRLATRKVLEELKFIDTVTLCLPLYLAGGEEERNFAKVFPTISVDGCDKLCAKRSTEKYSGKINGSLDVSKIIGNENALNTKIVRNKDITDEHLQMVDEVASEIVKMISGISSDSFSGKSFHGCGCGVGGTPALIAPTNNGVQLHLVAEMRQILADSRAPGFLRLRRSCSLMVFPVRKPTTLPLTRPLPARPCRHRRTRPW